MDELGWLFGVGVVWGDNLDYGIVVYLCGCYGFGQGFGGMVERIEGSGFV